MAIKKNLLIRNRHYQNARLTIVGSQSTDLIYYYTEATGNRYYYSKLSSTQSMMDMESATFESFLSFTMSGASTYYFNMVPMEAGTSVFLDFKVVGFNSSGSKSYLMKSFGGYRHSGSALTAIGGSITYDTKTDFTTASASFTTIGTASVQLVVSGQTSETIDWDIHIKYIKGFHDLIIPSGGGGGIPGPIYPTPPGYAPEY